MSGPVHALLLDLDDTLLDGSSGQSTILRTCRDISANRPELSQALLAEANKRAWSEYWPAVEDHWTLGRLEGTTVSIEAWRRTLQLCGCDDSALAAWAQERHWFHRSVMIRLFDDARALLDALVGRLPLGLVTNGASDTQRHALSSLGVEGLFAAIFISGERGQAKPNPQVFATVLEELGVHPHRAWHVGDNLRTDVAGAKAAGLRAVWLNRLGRSREPGTAPPDHEIRSLAELTPLLFE